MESLAQKYNKNLFEYALNQSAKKLAIIADEKSYVDNLPGGKFTVQHTGIVLRRFKIRILSEHDEGTPVENLPWAYGQAPNSGLRGESTGVPVYPPNSYVDVVKDPDTGIYYIIGVHCNTVSVLQNQQKDGNPPASGYIPGSTLFPVAQTHINSDKTGRADGGEICNVSVPSLEDEKQAKLGEDPPIPLPSKCRKVNTDAINYELTKLIKDIENLKVGLTGSNSFLQTSQNFINEVQSRISQASSKVAEWMSWLIQEIRKFVLRKINGAVNNLVGNAPVSSRYLINEAKKNALSVCSCLFAKLLQNLEGLIAQALNSIIDKILTTGECLIEALIGNIIGDIISQLTSLINGALGTLSSLLGTIISLTTDILDFVISILDFLSCKVDNICPVTENWNFLEGGQPSSLNIDFNNVFQYAKGIANQVQGSIANVPSDLNNLSFNLNIDANNILNQCVGSGNPQLCGPPNVVFWGGSGSGATGNVVVNSVGDIIGVDIVTPGNYGSTPPFVSFLDNCGNGTGAVGTAVLGNTSTLPPASTTTPTPTPTQTTTPTPTPTQTTTPTPTPTPTTTPTPSLTSTYSLFAPSFVDEGQRFTLVVVATNVSPGTLVYWDTKGNGITPSDFSSSTFLTGSGPLDQYGILTTDFILNQDNTTEGLENLEIYLYDDSSRTNQVASITVGIIDKSITTPTYSLVPSSSTIDEGQRVTMNVSTNNVAQGTVLYWNSSGSGIDKSDFSSSTFLKGSGVVRSNGKFSFDFVTTSDSKTEGPEVVDIFLYTDVALTNEVAKASVIINDTSTSAPTPSPSPTTGTTGVTGVIINNPGYNYLPKPNGSKGGNGRVWANQCQTAVKRANGNWDPVYSEGDLIKLFFGDTIELPGQSPVTIDCNFTANKLPGCSVTGTLTCLKSMVGFDDSKGGTTNQIPNIKSMVGFDDIWGSSPANTFPISAAHQQRIDNLLQTAEVKQAFIDDDNLVRQGLLPPRYRPDQFGFYQDYYHAQQLGYTDQDIRFYLEGFYLKILGKRLGPIMQVVLRDPNFGPLPKYITGQGTPGVFDCTTDYPYAISLGFTDQDIRYYLENFYTGTIDSCMQKNLNDPNWGKIPEFYVTLTAPGCPPTPPITTPKNNYNVNANIGSIFVSNGGFGFQPGDTATVLDCSGNPDPSAKLKLNINQTGTITSVDVISPGSNYTCIPQIVLNTNTGYNAELKPVLQFSREQDIDVSPGTEVISVVDCVGKV